MSTTANGATANGAPTTIPCVYDLLDLGSTGTWTDNGKIILQRPGTNSKLDRIKFRSFSATIRSDIQNLSSPTITAKLSGNLSYYNIKDAPADPATADADKVTGQELVLSTINDLAVRVTNQTGSQLYQPANGIYHNDVNNEVVFNEFNVPLITSFDDSINDMLRYAKYAFMKLMGVFERDVTASTNLDDVSSFMYGNINVNPYHSSYTLIYKGLTFANVGDTRLATSSESPTGTCETISLMSASTLLTYAQTTYNDVDMMTFETRRVHTGPARGLPPLSASTRVSASHNDIAVPWIINAMTVRGVEPIVPYNTPWRLATTDRTPLQFATASPFGVSISSEPSTYIEVNGQDDFYAAACSTIQNGSFAMTSMYVTVSMSGTSVEPMTTVADMKRRRLFGHMYDMGNVGGMPPCRLRVTTAVSPGNAGLIRTYDFTNMYANNGRMTSQGNEMIKMAMEDYVFINALATTRDGGAVSGKPLSLSTIDIAMVYGKGTTLKVLIFSVTDIDTTQTYQSIDFPAATQIITIDDVPASMMAIDEDWNVDNYLVYANELANAHVTNTPIIILPHAADGSNSFIYIKIEPNGSYGVYPSWTYRPQTGYRERVSVTNNTLTACRWNESGCQLTTYSPMCLMKVDGNDPNAITFAPGNPTFYNDFYVRWWSQYRYDESTKVNGTVHNIDVTDLVTRYGGMTYPIVNVTTNVDGTPTWMFDVNGAQGYIETGDTSKMFTFAESAFTVTVKEAREGGYDVVTLKPRSPTIGEVIAKGDDVYSWLTTNHITDVKADPYFYSKRSTMSTIDRMFTINAGIGTRTISFPCIALIDDNNTRAGLFTFYVKFETSPAIVTFDPNVRQGSRFADRYNVFKQFINRTPSMYVDDFPFDSYTFYVNRTLYEKVTVYLTLQNTDLTLKLTVDGFPSLNSILFYLNETSMIDFKEMTMAPFSNVIECTLTDSNGDVLTPALAKNIYSNITISADWTFYE